MNADAGYTLHGAFDASDWKSRVSEALHSFDALVKRSQSPITGSISSFQTSVVSSSTSLGAVLTGTEFAVEEMSRACSSNHTPPFILAEFGG